jgi:hypothetical protein
LPRHRTCPTRTAASTAPWHIPAGPRRRSAPSPRPHRAGVIATATTIDHGDASGAPSIIDASRNHHVSNISFVDRLHGTIRRSIAALHRRSNALCRSARTLQHQLELMRTVYNFVRPHQSLREGGKQRTPAMAAGLASRPLKLSEILRHIIRPVSGRNLQAYA